MGTYILLPICVRGGSKTLEILSNCLCVWLKRGKKVAYGDPIVMIIHKERVYKRRGRTMQWRRSCSSGNYQQWQNRNQTQHICNHHPVMKQQDHHSSHQGHQPCPRWPTLTSHQSWTLCTYELSSISFDGMNSCTHQSPTCLLLPVIAMYTKQRHGYMLGTLTSYGKE